MDDFERCVAVQVSHFDDPVLIKLQHLFVIDCTDPEVHFCVVFLYFDPHAIQMNVYFLLSTNETQQNIFPYSIAFVASKSQNECSSFLIVLILPDRFDLLLEEINVGADCEFRWSFEVLIVGPEVLDC